MRPAGDMAPGGAERAFLFLQGTSSALFMKCAKELEAAGHSCHRINFNMGDRLFWPRRNGHNYRGNFDAWPGYVRAFLKSHGITDLILLGEERPYHKPAAAIARELGIVVYVVEMGYLRPDWVTLERDGMSSNSHFPRDPQVILQAAADVPEPDWTVRYTQTFLSEALLDLFYNLSAVSFGFLYPHFRWHGVFHPLAEYYGWIGRLVKSRSRRMHAAATIRRISESGDPYFLYPLQLQTDYQLRAHSPYASQQQAIDEILSSFAAHAPADSRLLVKIHPLDNALIDWQGMIEREAQALKVEHRIDVIDGGNLDALFERSTGLVTVNSTAAISALRRGLAVKVLGAAIYDIDGITDQRTLDDFWSAPLKPDPVLTRAFFRLLAGTIQVRGNLYSSKGTTAAAKAIAQRLMDRSVP
ncbi:MAG: capsular biosynthesis protein [Shinella sp.]|nr:capsular biosynthesis protein [Shinella sp.]